MDKAKLNLLKEQPYYASILSRCVLHYTDKIPTAGVGMFGNELRLIVNRKFFDSLSPNHKVGLLIHEMGHIVYNHLEKGKKYDRKDLKILNVAQDIAINSWIQDELLPDGGMTAKRFGFEPRLSSEHYFGLLKQKQKEMQDEMDKGGFDEHNLEVKFDENGNISEVTMDGEPKEMSEMDKAALENAISRAYHETKEKELQQKIKHGSIPQLVEREIQRLEQEKKGAWKNILRQFVGSNLAKHTESTRTKPNRRFGFSATGYRKEYLPSVAIAIDQSGSVSDELISLFFAEVNSILSNVQDCVQLVFFDTQIAQEVKLDKYNATKLKRYATGGTSFDCVFEYTKKKRYDLVIVMTDGEAPTPENQPRNIPVLWALPNGASHDHLKGKKLFVSK